MIKHPLLFKVSASTNSGISTTWKTSAESTVGSLSMAIPHEFEGPGGGYSPEDIYAFALLNCFAATFKVIAEKSNLDFKELNLSGVLTVDRNEKGFPWMKHFLLKAALSECADPERGKRLLEKASQSCLILNSVLTEKAFEFSVD